jgi:MFS family permease
VDGALYIPGMIQKAIAINPIIVLFGILGFIAGFSISLGPVMWTMFSEIFPNQLRGIAISVVGTFNTITSFLVATFFPIQIQWLGSGWTYMTYAFCMVACLVFVYLFVIETKGKSLEVLEEELMLTE